VNEVIDHLRGFRRNGSPVDEIYCIQQILERQQYNHLFTEFSKEGSIV